MTLTELFHGDQAAVPFDQESAHINLDYLQEALGKVLLLCLRCLPSRLLPLHLHYLQNQKIQFENLNSCMSFKKKYPGFSGCSIFSDHFTLGKSSTKIVDTTNGSCFCDLRELKVSRILSIHQMHTEGILLHSWASN